MGQFEPEVGRRFRPLWFVFNYKGENYDTLRGQSGKNVNYNDFVVVIFEFLN